MSSSLDCEHRLPLLHSSSQRDSLTLQRPDGSGYLESSWSVPSVEKTNANQVSATEEAGREQSSAARQEQSSAAEAHQVGSSDAETLGGASLAGTHTQSPCRGLSGRPDLPETHQP